MAADAGQQQQAEAKQHYAQGARLYDLSELERALAEFKTAYELSGDAAFLFNIAQCHRRLGHTQEAITFYRSYLRRAPNTKLRGEVERRIAELERARATEPESARPPPPAPAAPPSSPPPSVLAPAPRPEPEAQVVLARPEPEPRPVPIYRRGWFWVGVGAVVAGGVVTAVLLSRGSSPAICPECATTVGLGP